MSERVMLPVLTVSLPDWEDQIERVNAVTHEATGETGMLMEGLAAWMEEMERLINEGPVIVATNPQARQLRVQVAHVARLAGLYLEVGSDEDDEDVDSST